MHISGSNLQVSTCVATMLSNIVSQLSVSCVFDTGKLKVIW